MNNFLDKLLIALVYAATFMLVVTAATAISLAMWLRGWSFWEVATGILTIGIGMALASHLLLEFAERKVRGD